MSRDRCSNRRCNPPSAQLSCFLAEIQSGRRRTRLSMLGHPCSTDVDDDVRSARKETSEPLATSAKIRGLIQLQELPAIRIAKGITGALAKDAFENIRTFSL